MLHLETARLLVTQTQAPAAPSRVMHQPAKPGHGTAGQQRLTKPAAAPGCRALADRGTAERESEPGRGEERQHGNKETGKEKRGKKGEGKRKAKWRKGPRWQGAALLHGQGAARAGAERWVCRVPPSRRTAGLLPVSRLCSSISGCVRCTGTIFLPVPVARAATGPAQRPAVEAANTSAGCPGLPGSRPPARAGSGGAVPRHRGARAGRSGSWTRLSHAICLLVRAGCVPPSRSKGLLCL